MSLPAMSSSPAERVGQGRWVGHLKGANSMAVSGLSIEEALVGTELAISVLLFMNGLRK